MSTTLRRCWSFFHAWGTLDALRQRFSASYVQQATTSQTYRGAAGLTSPCKISTAGNQCSPLWIAGRRAGPGVLRDPSDHDNLVDGSIFAWFGGRSICRLLCHLVCLFVVFLLMFNMETSTILGGRSLYKIEEPSQNKHIG